MSGLNGSEIDSGTVFSGEGVAVPESLPAQINDSTDGVRVRKVVRIADGNDSTAFSKAAVQISNNMQPGKSILTVKNPPSSPHAHNANDQLDYSRVLDPLLAKPQPTLRPTSTIAQKLLSNLPRFGRKTPVKDAEKNCDAVSSSDDESDSSSEEETTDEDEESSDSESSKPKDEKTLSAEKVRKSRKLKKRVPDGGYGWVMVACSFAILFVADGILDTFGVIFVYLLRFFDESKSKTSWVGATFTTVPLILGPVASALTEMYGCRCMTVIGGLFGTLGFVLSYYADSIAVLCLTVGVVAGIGWSLVYVTSTIILFRWFDKRLALAMGLASSGSGIGAFVFAPLHHFLLQNYGFKGLSCSGRDVNTHEGKIHIFATAGFGRHHHTHDCRVRRPYAEETERARQSAINAKQSKLQFKQRDSPEKVSAVNDAGKLLLHSSSAASTATVPTISPPSPPQQQQQLLTPVMPIPLAFTKNSHDVEACVSSGGAPGSSRFDCPLPLTFSPQSVSSSRRYSLASLDSRRRDHNHHHRHSKRRGSRTSLLSEALPNVGHNIVAQEAIELEQMRQNEEADEAAAAADDDEKQENIWNVQDDSGVNNKAVTASSLPPRTVDYCCSVLELPTYMQNTSLLSDAEARLLLGSVRSPQTAKNFRNGDFATRIEDIELGYAVAVEPGSPNMVSVNQPSQIMTAAGGRMAPRLLAVRNASLSSCMPTRRSLDSLFVGPSGLITSNVNATRENDGVHQTVPSSFPVAVPDDADDISRKHSFQHEYAASVTDEQLDHRGFLYNLDPENGRSSRTLDGDNAEPLLIASPSFASDLEAVAAVSDGDLSNAVFLRDGISYSLHELFNYRGIDAATRSDMVLSSPPRSKARYRESSGNSICDCQNDFGRDHSVGNDMELMPLTTDTDVNGSVLAGKESQGGIVLDLGSENDAGGQHEIQQTDRRARIDSLTRASARFARNMEKEHESKLHQPSPASGGVVSGEVPRPATASRSPQKQLRKSHSSGQSGPRRSHRRHTTSSPGNVVSSRKQQQSSAADGSTKHHRHSGSRSQLHQQQQQLRQRQEALLARASQYQLRPSVLNVIQRIQRHQRNIHSRQQKKQSKRGNAPGPDNLAQYRPSAVPHASGRRSANQRGGRSSAGVVRGQTAANNGGPSRRQQKQASAASPSAANNTLFGFLSRQPTTIPANQTKNTSSAAHHHAHQIDRRGIAFVMPNPRQLASTFSMSCPDIVKEFRRLHKHHSRDGTTAAAGRLKRGSKKPHHLHHRMDGALKPDKATGRRAQIGAANSTGASDDCDALLLANNEPTTTDEYIPVVRRFSLPHDDYAVSSFGRVVNIDAVRSMKSVKPAFSTRSLPVAVVVNEHKLPRGETKTSIPHGAIGADAKIAADSAVQKHKAVAVSALNAVPGGSAAAVDGTVVRAAVNAQNTTPKPPPPIKKLPPPPPARRRLVELFKYMTNLSAFKSKTFLLLIISNFINFAPLDVPLDYLVDFAVEMNITAEMQASLLLSIVGIVSMVGQVLYGWYGDRTSRPVLVYAASIMMCGVLTCGLPFLPYLPLPYSCMVAYSVLFSFFKSACQPLFAVILVETVPQQYLTNGFGFLHLVQGIASLLGPPLAGSLIDMRLLVIGADGKNSYVLSFIFSGIAMVASGLLMIPISLSTSEFNGSDDDDDSSSSSSSSSSSDEDDESSSSSSSSSEDDDEELSTTLSSSSADDAAATQDGALLLTKAGIENGSVSMQNSAAAATAVRDGSVATSSSGSTLLGSAVGDKLSSGSVQKKRRRQQPQSATPVEEQQRLMDAV